MPLFVPTDVQREFFRRMDGEALIESDFTDFIATAEGVSGVAAGAGAGVFNPPLAVNNDHPGVWALRTGGTAVGRVFIISRVDTYMVGVGGATMFQSWVQVPILSGGAQRFTVRSGFSSVVLPNVLIQSIGFEYDDLQNGGRWQAITHAGVETSTDTGILVTAGTWYKLAFVVNADGTAVAFFIDDVLVVTNTTNIPIGPVFRNFVNIHIMKLLGTTSRDCNLDAYAVFQETAGRE